MAAPADNERPATDVSAPPTGRRPWTEASIRAALAALLAGRTTWPTYQEFIDAGAKGVRDAVARSHGPEWWAAEFGVTGGGRPRGGVRRWSDAAIRATLAEFLGDRTAWPTQREFRSAGHAGLCEALRLRGGAQRWAREMGVAAPRSVSHPRPRPPSVPRRAVPTVWTHQRIAAELSAFLASRSEWPRYADFVAAGRKGLYRAVRDAGGCEAWARRMGVRYERRRGGLPAYWTEERVREGLAELLAGRDRWPTSAEFAAAGERRLLAAVWRHGGVKRWRVEFGVGRPRPLDASAADATRPRIWTDAAIRDAISPLVENLGRWPTKREFRAAGLLPALAAVYVHGGRRTWQRRLGVTAHPFRAPVPDRTRWSEETIERELRRICAGRTDWPSQAEFAASGALGLYRAASRRGGIGRWRRQVGL